MAELLAVELLNRLKKDIVDRCWGSIMSSELPRVVGSDEQLTLRKRRFRPCFLMHTDTSFVLKDEAKQLKGGKEREERMLDTEERRTEPRD